MVITPMQGRSTPSPAQKENDVIDTKELRRLAQAATPGPWFSDRRGNIWRRPLSDLYENGGGVAGDKPLAFVAAGWAGEGVTGYPVEANARFIAAANPAAVSELLDRLEVAERERDLAKAEIARLHDDIRELTDVRDTLRAKIEHMERQEPVAWATKRALEYGASTLGFGVSSVNIWGEKGVPLYARRGAKGE